MFMQFHPYFDSITYRSGFLLFPASLESQIDRSTFAISSFLNLHGVASRCKAEQAAVRQRPDVLRLIAEGPQLCLLLPPTPVMLSLWLVQIQRASSGNCDDFCRLQSWLCLEERGCWLLLYHHSVFCRNRIDFR